MKIKNGYILRHVADVHMVVPVGERTREFRGMMTLSETNAFMWRQLETQRSYAELLGALVAEYCMEENDAKLDLDEFLTMIRESGALEE